MAYGGAQRKPPPRSPHTQKHTTHRCTVAKSSSPLSIPSIPFFFHAVLRLLSKLHRPPNRLCTQVIPCARSTRPIVLYAKAKRAQEADAGVQRTYSTHRLCGLSAGLPQYALPEDKRHRTAPCIYCIYIYISAYITPKMIYDERSEMVNS